MRVLFVFAAIWMTAPVIAQMKTPVHWAFSAKKISSTSYEIHLTGTIDAGWHTYSQTTPAGGPVPTTISFTANPLVVYGAKASEVGKLDQHFEKMFGVDVKQYADKIDFVEKVTLKHPVQTNITGTINFMVCNDKECLPPSDQPFSISIP